jgi:hypothetical protein
MGLNKVKLSKRDVSIEEANGFAQNAFGINNFEWD